MKAKIILPLILGCTLTGYAQTETSITFNRTTGTDSVILEQARSKSPHEIPVPKFVLKSENNKFMMTIGGKMSTVMGWDLGNNLYEQDGAGVNFTTQLIPVPSTAGHRSDFFINALNAAIDFQIVGLTGTPDQITGYLKIATNKSTGALKLSRAYISWRNFTLGKKLTLFEDDSASQPPTIDSEGPSGTVNTTVYEVGYKSPSYNEVRYAVGIDKPSWYASNGVYRGKDYPSYDGQQVADYGDAEQILPDIPAWVEYSASTWNRIRFSALLRNFAYRDLVDNTTRHKMGWGLMLSGNLTPAKNTIFYYQLTYGKGIGAYLQDIAGMPLSFVPEDDRPGKMKATPMAGINFGFTYNINSKWQANIMASESRIWGVEDYAVAENKSNYKYALYAAGNVFHNITPYLQWGMEYVWGHRQTWDMGGAHDSRIQTQLKFTF